jgi:hypothetical protein
VVGQVQRGLDVPPAGGWAAAWAAILQPLNSVGSFSARLVGGPTATGKEQALGRAGGPLQRGQDQMADARPSKPQVIVGRIRIGLKAALIQEGAHVPPPHIQ